MFDRLARSPDWVAEAKLDGARVVAVCGPDAMGALGFDSLVQAMSRTGTPFMLPAGVSHALRRAKRALELDGEVYQGAYWVFDCGSLGSADLDYRRRIIEETVEEISSDVVRVMPRLGPDPWSEVESHDWEGCVFKRRSSPYRWADRPGATTDSWIKFRQESKR
jgi:ATP-dependent DNA ligase